MQKKFRSAAFVLTLLPIMSICTPIPCSAILFEECEKDKRLAFDNIAHVNDNYKTHIKVKKKSHKKTK